MPSLTLHRSAPYTTASVLAPQIVKTLLLARNAMIASLSAKGSLCMEGSQSPGCTVHREFPTKSENHGPIVWPKETASNIIANEDWAKYSVRTHVSCLGGRGQRWLMGVGSGGELARCCANR